jgi:hypothetical protein
VGRPRQQRRAGQAARRPSAAAGRPDPLPPPQARTPRMTVPCTLVRRRRMPLW